MKRGASAALTTDRAPSVAANTMRKSAPTLRPLISCGRVARSTIDRERDQPQLVGSCEPGSVMCWKCEQIDKEISHYQGLSARVTEEGSVKSLDILIAKLKEEKTALHVVEFNPPAKRVPPR